MTSLSKDYPEIAATPRVIFKYPCPGPGGTMMLPRGAQILTVQMQGGEPVVWALVDPAAPDEVRRVRVFGTGHYMPGHPGIYVGTFQDGPFVWHVFDATTAQGAS